jgi:hypothetical protein
MNCALPVLLYFVYPGHDASCPYIITLTLSRRGDRGNKIVKAACPFYISNSKKENV